MKRLLGLLVVLVAAGLVVAETTRELSVTIYNNDLGLVKDVRKIDVPKGVNTVDFTEVAAQIDATSVNFRCLDDKEVAVLEQNFLYDLVSSEALLKRYLGKSIEVLGQDNKRYRGTLLAYDSKSLVLGGPQEGVTVVSLDKIVDYQFPSLPEALLVRPTLRWLIDSPSAGSKRCEVSYLTSGINWQADYVAVVSADDRQLDLFGWVTIRNQSGATYENARLKLVAGDVHMLTPPRPRGLGAEFAVSAKAAPQFEQEEFFEYHLYTLGRPATVADKEIKQLSLFPATRTTAKKIYIFDAGNGYFAGEQAKVKVKVNLEFENSQKAGLGMPLPKGRLRVYKADTHQALQFVGEDLIDHTPKDEKVRVYLGDAFDITGQRKVVSHEELDRPRGSYRETYEIILKNHKKEDIVVTVVERPAGWREWVITKSNIQFKKIDNYRVEFEVSVPADGEASLVYTIQYM